MNRRTVLAVTTGALLLSACTGTGGSSKGAEAKAPDDPSKVSGAITVLTHRTDLVQDGTMKKYAAEFNKTYPEVKVEFDAITDYEGEVKIRMNTENYGDVLMIPAVIEKKDYPRFFASLGTQAERSKTYRFTDYTTVDGKVYGQSPLGAVPGFIYNKKVWSEAGVTDWPTTPAEFLDDLKAIKSKTDAIPYYTNFKDMWPLTQWTDVNGSVSCDEQATTGLAEGDPWAEGADLRTADTLLYDIVHEGLVEKDPTTTNWEASKPRIAKGEIATMWLGSWAVIQMQGAAKQAGTDPDDIGFMPFPAQRSGTFCAVAKPDYNQAVNIHSEHKEAARAWLDWFTDKSGYAADNLALSPLKSAPLPTVMKPYEEAGVKILDLDDTKGAVVKSIDNQSEIGIYKPDYRQDLVDLARGATKGDLDDFLNDLGKKWTETQRSLGS
ncbi:sugar ABC transporter substrate-binding protein [Streptomyces viridochromogenes]|uniref:Sugar ABC transporter substrate-binding protein n=1 Tax=Streptomyces viridochromogenes TaxID=1938 RepID=A0A0J7Z6P5_STRVR|nr:ABC transporter substrate-binding protein [Streptomyces viridochromogenes]KMS71861.1 sugar ABC transporter substrate-binding protein [Streptomyces viridochromogenes]KOG21148.1 sugar ABC transporter substrate-binding protein [Streptomyces viridochromogenes]KOG22678.1 sugar ABC transporter substrate-binding protein [Streptomyces viridochromogenes]